MHMWEKKESVAFDQKGRSPIIYVVGAPIERKISLSMFSFSTQKERKEEKEETGNRGNAGGIGFLLFFI